LYSGKKIHDVPGLARGDRYRWDSKDLPSKRLICRKVCCREIAPNASGDELSGSRFLTEATIRGKQL